MSQKMTKRAIGGLDTGGSADLRMGQILLDAGKLSLEDAERVLRLQKEKGLRFGEAAKALNLITEEDIQRVLARQFDYPVFSPGEANVSAELVAAFSPYSTQVEALRGLRSQLMLRWFGPQKNTLAIVGATPGCGISYTAANLAVVFSQLGERTLLIDADLRAPRQHEIFSLDNRLGLSDLIVGRTDAEALVHVPGFVGLSVLPAGTLPPNPQEILSRPVFGKWLDRFSENFDVVLVDTTSGSGSADAQNVAARTGGALMVARKDHTRLAEAMALKDLITGAGAALVGAVLTEF